MTGRGGCQIKSRGITAQCISKGFISPGQAEEDFIISLFVPEMRWIMGLYEVEVKVPGGYGSRTLIRGPEEKVSLTCSLPLDPLQFVLPDFITGDIGLVNAFHDEFQ